MVILGRNLIENALRQHLQAFFSVPLIDANQFDVEDERGTAGDVEPITMLIKRVAIPISLTSISEAATLEDGSSYLFG